MEQRPFCDASYEQFLNEEKMMGSKCLKCQATYLPPRPLCIKCNSKDMEWLEMKGIGKLLAFTCIGIGPSSMREQGFDRNNPYCSGVVGLEEGVRIDALIFGYDNKKPENIKIGSALKASFLHRGEKGKASTLPVFEPITK